jgi:hypothetical protein
MITLTIDEYFSAIESQNVPRKDATFLCPHCGTLQSANDLIKAGAGKTSDDISGVLAFSCIGRWDNSKGCDWTLGGLIQIHELEVIDSKGIAYPRFIPISAEQCL